ncbi:hypothetical protein D9M68_796360 [compost metagenome]
MSPETQRVRLEESGIRIDSGGIVGIHYGGHAAVGSESIALQVTAPAIVFGRAEQCEVELVLVVLPVETVHRGCGVHEGGVSGQGFLNDGVEGIGKTASIARRITLAAATPCQVIQEGLCCRIGSQGESDRMGGNNVLAIEVGLVFSCQPFHQLASTALTVITASAGGASQARDTALRITGIVVRLTVCQQY